MFVSLHQLFLLQQHSQYQSRVRLDRDIEQDSDAYQQRHREALNNHERGGVEVAPAHYHRRDMDASTISDSYYFGSRNSMELQGYISSSQAPDTNSYYESSDCRVCGNHGRVCSSNSVCFSECSSNV